MQLIPCQFPTNCWMATFGFCATHPSPCLIFAREKGQLQTHLSAIEKEGIPWKLPGKILEVVDDNPWENQFFEMTLRASKDVMKVHNG